MKPSDNASCLNWEPDQLKICLRAKCGGLCGCRADILERRVHLVKGHSGAISMSRRSSRCQAVERCQRRTVKESSSKERTKESRGWFSLAIAQRFNDVTCSKGALTRRANLRAKESIHGNCRHVTANP